jgi:hypothetical protein
MSDPADSYWDLANVITGFVVVQAIAFLWALGDKAKFEKVKKASRLLWLVGSIAFVAYAAAVVFCYYAAAAIRAETPPQPPHWIYLWTMRGQCIVIFLNTLGVIALAQYVFRKTDPTYCVSTPDT